MLLCDCGQKWREETVLALRVVTGLLFIYHGYSKIFGMGVDATAGFFSNVGIPAAGILAPLVAYGEFLGGIALVLGIFTHWVSKLNIIIMLGAIFFVHFANGYDMSKGGYEYQLLILVTNLYFLAHGAGKYSLDARRGQSHTV